MPARGARAGLHAALIGVLALGLGATQARPAAADGAMEPGRIIAALTADWTGDGLLDAALIIRAKDGMADLVVLTGGEPAGLEPSARAEAAIFAGPMAGQTPSLAPRSDSSFVVQMEQTAIGRTPWESELTIAWRGGQFVVAGFTHRFYDRLDPERQGQCDVNLLTGRYELDYSPGTGIEPVRRSGAGEDRAFPLDALHEDYFPAVCAALHH
ncbi:MAG: hypothetical protein ACK4LQ_13550 [Pararhodobacter sp.]